MAATGTRQETLEVCRTASLSREPVSRRRFASGRFVLLPRAGFEPGAGRVAPRIAQGFDSTQNSPRRKRRPELRIRFNSTAPVGVLSSVADPPAASACAAATKRAVPEFKCRSGSGFRDPGSEEERIGACFDSESSSPVLGRLQIRSFRPCAAQSWRHAVSLLEADRREQGGGRGENRYWIARPGKPG